MFTSWNFKKKPKNVQITDRTIVKHKKIEASSRLTYHGELTKMRKEATATIESLFGVQGAAKMNSW